MSVVVRRLSDGTILMSRCVPTDIPGASTVALRFRPDEWAAFLTGLRAGEFDALIASHGSRDAEPCPAPTPTDLRPATAQPDSSTGVQR